MQALSPSPAQGGCRRQAQDGLWMPIVHAIDSLARREPMRVGMGAWNAATTAGGQPARRWRSPAETIPLTAAGARSL